MASILEQDFGDQDSEEDFNPQQEVGSDEEDDSKNAVPNGRSSAGPPSRSRSVPKDEDDGAPQEEEPGSSQRNGADEDHDEDADGEADAEGEEERDPEEEEDEDEEDEEDEVSVSIPAISGKQGWTDTSTGTIAETAAKGPKESVH